MIGPESLRGGRRAGLELPLAVAVPGPGLKLGRTPGPAGTGSSAAWQHGPSEGRPLATSVASHVHKCDHDRDSDSAGASWPAPPLPWASVDPRVALISPVYRHACSGPKHQSVTRKRGTDDATTRAQRPQLHRADHHRPICRRAFRALDRFDLGQLLHSARNGGIVPAANPSGPVRRSASSRCAHGALAQHATRAETKRRR
jgi:hypothetical protein